MKLLRTIRFDQSDTRIFDCAAQPDEWAISGAFEFHTLQDKELTGKIRQAFANGFLGLTSFGRSTFATVSEADETQIAAIEAMLAAHFVDVYGAPDLEEAKPVAREEIEFVIELCRNSPINTVFTLRRYFGEDGKIHEEFRTISAPTNEPQHSKIWKVVKGDS